MKNKLAIPQEGATSSRIFIFDLELKELKVLH